MKTPEEIVDDSGILLTKNAIEAGISKHALYNFIRNNGFEKAAHGVYASPETWEDENYILSLRCPQGVLSHDEALYYHGLTDREPLQKTITIYTGYGTSRMVADGIKVFTVKKELLDIGKEIVKTSYGHDIPLYNRERTICDLIRSKNRFEIQDFQTALKTYIMGKNKNLNRLMEYAKLFHVDKKIREYMEVLL
ncbi:MAG: type IV toxin-antitoxin system AbiEi family antitoxin domain-containing protein [Dialister sp.]|uniref:type IV toxin-antitoxin system AbiEi family antitoxin domain-containing protein n=1 Tax=Dialister sp. TaxID=1955814 RepID=UPI001D6C4FDD|nr:abortive phage infection protein [Dialister sp.]MBS6715112.1 type IV toxin-antitoxin system AbiEi family antitoxin domain-containing protein [Dialister sp.]